MKREQFDSEIKVRMPSWMRQQAERAALMEERDLSDIVRRAVREYVSRNRNPGSSEVLHAAGC